MRIETPLLITGGGPAALVAARVASGSGLQSLVVGHELLGGEEPVPLESAALAVLTPHGVLDVLRPYLVVGESPAIAPRLFEGVLKHHCVVDMNITVYDAMTVVDLHPQRGGVRAVLHDGRSRWEVDADAHIDADKHPHPLSAAILAGAEAANRMLALLPERRSTPSA